MNNTPKNFSSARKVPKPKASGRSLVSVILPVYNGEKYIPFALESILGQSYTNLELIVVDDASTDRSAEVVAGFKDRRVRLVRLKKNRGPAFARNAGLVRAKGEWVGFIDADDCWAEERLERLMHLAHLQQGKVCLASDVLVCLSGKNEQLIPIHSICRARECREKVIFFRSMLEFALSGFDLKPLCPKSMLDKHKIRFNEETRGTEWREFIFRLFQAGLTIVVLNQPLYKYRVTTRSLSSGYRTVKHEIATTDHLMKLPWIDEETKAVILRSRKAMSKRLLTTALRERKWKEALAQAAVSPASLLYLARRGPKYLQERLTALIR